MTVIKKIGNPYSDFQITLAPIVTLHEDSQILFTTQQNKDPGDEVLKPCK